MWQAIDPFWDSLSVNMLGSYVSYLRVNTSLPGPAQLYLDPAVTLPVHVKGTRRSRHDLTEQQRRVALGYACSVTLR